MVGAGAAAGAGTADVANNFLISKRSLLASMIGGRNGFGGKISGSTGGASGPGTVSDAISTTAGSGIDLIILTRSIAGGFCSDPPGSVKW